MRGWLKQSEAALARLAQRLPGSSRQFGPPRSIGLAADAASQARGDLRLHQLFPERIVSRPAAEWADPPFAAELGKPAEARLKPVFVAELPNGRYWGRYFGYVIDRSDRLVPDLSPTFTGPGRHDGLNRLLLPRCRDFDGTVAVVSTLFSENFHHWLLDTVPRFGWLERAGWKLDGIDRFIVPGQRHAYHRETFARLGIDERKLIAHDQSLHLRARLLLAPSASEPANEPHLHDYTSEGLDYVRRLFLNDNPHLDEESPRRIIVSREKAKVRRWVQAERAGEWLRPLGFAKVLLEDHSVAKQAALFHAADCIIMPTGGNLANLVFCRPGTVVIELFSPHYTPRFQHALMGPLGLRHFSVVGEKVALPFPGASGPDEDIDVDPARLEGIVRQALGI